MHSFRLGLNNKIALPSSSIKVRLKRSLPNTVAPHSHRFTLALKGDRAIEFRHKVFSRNKFPIVGWCRGTRPNMLESFMLLGFLTSTQPTAMSDRTIRTSDFPQTFRLPPGLPVVLPYPPLEGVYRISRVPDFALKTCHGL